MLRVREVPARDWPALAARFRDLSYEQSLAYAVPAAARLGAQARFLAVEREGDPVAAAAVRLKTVPGLGRGIAWIASGPLTLQGEAPPSEAEMTAVLAALREEIAGRKGHVLRLRLPALHRRAAGDWARIAAGAGFAPSARARGYRSFALDLSRDEDALLAGLDKKWRQELRAAWKAGLELEQGRAQERERELGPRFRALYDRVREAKGFDSELTPEFYWDLEGPDFRHDILIARHEGEDAAGIVIGDTGPTAVYLFGATAEPGRRTRAGYLLTWEAIRLARARGLAWYDLGGADEAANPGVHRFKKRMGGEAIEGGGPFEAKPAGLLPRLLEGLEDLRARAKGRR